MKTCPHCEVENEDQYIYCVKCRKPLPKLSRLELKFANGTHALDKGDYKGALRFFDEILKLNIGDKDAWFMKGITLLYLKDRKGAMDCLNRSGVKVGGGVCKQCGGFKRCPDCGGSGGCYMCKGTGRCPICHGSGKCTQCGQTEEPTPECRVCGGTKECRRCGGAGECEECKGSGTCACGRTGICPYCGGSGHSLQLNVNDVPAHLRKYVPK